MRLSNPLSILLVLPALSIAETPAQKPLLENVQSWLSAAQTYLPSAAEAYLPSAIKAYLPSAAVTTSLTSLATAATSAASSASSSATSAASTTPISAATAAAAAAASITPINTDNWRTILSPSPSRASPDLDGRETWMVLVSGGNKTCLGQCERLDAEWKKTAALLGADPLTANTSPRLGYINCDASPVLCALWAARPITLWHIQFPAVHVDTTTGRDSTPSTETTVRVLKLNMTSTIAEDLVRIHTQKTYEETPVLDSIFQPFDGLLVQNGVAIPVAYVIAGFSMIPSWVFMIVISFVSRNIMNRRTSTTPNTQRQAPAAAAGGAAPAPNQ